MDTFEKAVGIGWVNVSIWAKQNNLSIDQAKLIIKDTECEYSKIKRDLFAKEVDLNDGLKVYLKKNAEKLKKNRESNLMRAKQKKLIVEAFKEANIKQTITYTWSNDLLECQFGDKRIYFTKEQFKKFQAKLAAEQAADKLEAEGIKIDGRAV